MVVGVGVSQQPRSGERGRFRIFAPGGAVVGMLCGCLADASGFLFDGLGRPSYDEHEHEHEHEHELGARS
jgi:hypothetical protein